ncbi:bacillithiol system redox-active protein YtxJ [Cellulophaga omnivescoria]|uniref:bacillithiol system redox-active protein YtxJ n=1 Tax=Cellulophaga omnivescoria TaxID=1888890 RepID=UPI000984A150|nr:bacillithiol system redox-active protein YtxJ [Cellulophaga omnivescoria]WBU88832.1 bacillithiol system redox-active protein YtxJ [Cellulophaga omnivescoria]
MGIFTGLFGGKEENKKEEKELPWIPLTAVTQLPEIEEKSKTKTQIIFKHSTSCGISRMVIKMFKNTYNFAAEEADLYYLDLLQYREVSNEVGYKFQVIHESPQLLVIKNGVTVANASHGAITELDLEKYS